MGNVNSYWWLVFGWAWDEMVQCLDSIREKLDDMNKYYKSTGHPPGGRFINPWPLPKISSNCDTPRTTYCSIPPQDLVLMNRPISPAPRTYTVRVVWCQVMASSSSSGSNAVYSLQPSAMVATVSPSIAAAIAMISLPGRSISMYSTTTFAIDSNIDVSNIRWWLISLVMPISAKTIRTR